MRKLFFLILFLTTNFQLLTNANEIREFDIDGVSVGDSLLDYISKDFIESKTKSFYPNSKKYYVLEFDSQELSFLDRYPFIGFHLKKNDKKYIIYSLKGMMDYDNDLDSCLKQKKEIVNSIKDTLADSKELKYENNYDNLYGKSKAYISDFKVSDGYVRVWCNNWDKKNENSKGFIDTINVDLSDQKFLDWLNTDAYK